MSPDNITLSSVVTVACFFGTGILLVGGSVVFAFTKDAAFKRQWFSRFIILVGVLFAFFSTAMTASESNPIEAVGLLALIVPFVGLVCYSVIIFTRFCSRCGATLYERSWIYPMRFCSQCGAELDPKSSKPDTDPLE